MTNALNNCVDKYDTRTSTLRQMYFYVGLRIFEMIKEK
jgi:hypothetical protein